MTIIVHKNPYFSVNLKDEYYSINFPTKQVLVLPVIQSSYILFIKAIRPVFTEPVIELHAGTVDEGETLKAAALRELDEVIQKIQSGEIIVSTAIAV